MICNIMVRIAGIAYIPFAPTIPFRLLFGILAWIAILLWYHLQIVADTSLQTEKFTAPEVEKAAPLPQEESIDRITVKDGSRIHIIKVEDLLYIQACGDYTTLVTPDGEYIKEQTMKYFETHLPADNFVQNYLFLYFAMMKHLYYILMFTFLCLGLTAISQEEQPNSRNTAGSPASECSFTAYTQCASYAVTHRSLFNDENTDCWTNEALCPNSLYTHNHASPKFLKMRILKLAGQLEHLLSSHLSAGESANLSFNPNALRYSCGYYIYALLHILI